MSVGFIPSGVRVPNRMAAHCCGLCPQQFLPRHRVESSPAHRRCVVADRSEALRDPCEALTLQKRQYLLGQLVGLGHHGGAGLLQDLCTRQVGGLLREVGVQNA